MLPCKLVKSYCIINTWSKGTVVEFLHYLYEAGHNDELIQLLGDNLDGIYHGVD